MTTQTRYDLKALFLLMLLVAATAADAQVQPQQAKASVAGSVVRATSGDPIARATLTLTRVNQGPRNAGIPAINLQQGQQGQQPESLTATTDEQGRFQFRDVDEGAYRLTAARNGFVLQENGQRSLSRQGTVLDLRAGQQVTDVGFRLMPASTISGRVLDSNGEPIPGVTVQALRSTYEATGKRTLQPTASDRTNDLGEYRIYWINPGRYFVSANTARTFADMIAAGASQMANQPPNPEQAQAVGLASSMFGGAAGTPNEVIDFSLGLTYYPGTNDASRAVALDLQPGSEMRAVDFTLSRTQRVRITGLVIDANTGRPPQDATVSVTPRDSLASPLDALIGGAAGNRYNSSTGEFMVGNIANGSYWLQVVAPGQAPNRAPNAPATPADAFAVINSINSAHMPIEVQGSDITNLVLSVGPGMTLRGRIQMDGGQPVNATELSRLGFSLQSMSGGISILTMLRGGVVRAAPDGTFSFPRITTGDYKLSVTGIGPNLYLKEARFGRDDALDGLTISDQPSGELEVILRPNPGQVTGIVMDATQKPAAGVQAVLVPDKARSPGSLSNSEYRFGWPLHHSRHYAWRLPDFRVGGH
jgi:protocatechuate 3,4-dioxygenase beta subunit